MLATDTTDFLWKHHLTALDTDVIRFKTKAQLTLK